MDLNQDRQFEFNNENKSILEINIFEHFDNSVQSQ